MAEKGVNEIPRDVRPLFTKGSDALARENFDYAIALFNQVLAREPAEVDDLLALRGNRQLRHHQVDLSGLQRRQQRVARHGQQHHVQVELAFFELQLPVEFVLEEREVFVGEPARLALVEEVERAVERDTRTDQAPPDEGVEITREDLVDRVRSYRPGASDGLRRRPRSETAWI